MTKSRNSDLNQNHLLVPEVWLWTFEGVEDKMPNIFECLESDVLGSKK